MPTQPDNLQPIGFTSRKQQIQGRMTNIEEAIFMQSNLPFSNVQPQNVV
ncbi:hypothetical protein MCC93_21570 [Morococcus cerebrosus]|uniref:Uncharacterized protein n=1 Tax=Morococcus cerebrosus TaxID=1056807 RepID=A0A0C1GIM8_9NEIS|nr:hypothetical protein MCC93_21570 [Morococcus cerebrosus]KJJ09782.1 hypothetical protein HMPREF3156_02905 [Neisseria sp. HMSC06F02]